MSKPRTVKPKPPELRPSSRRFGEKAAAQLFAELPKGTVGMAAVSLTMLSVMLAYAYDEGRDDAETLSKLRGSAPSCGPEGPKCLAFGCERCELDAARELVKR